MPERSRNMLARGWAGIRHLLAREQMLTGPQVGATPNGVGDLLYARGFLLSRTHHVPSVVAAWARWKVGDWHLHVDPRVPVSHAAAKSQEVWVIGDAFHVESGIFTNVAAWILEGNVLEKLDGLSGRFLVIHRQAGRTDIYNDALGSRSVFYGKDVVASHSELAASLIGTGLRDWLIPFITSRGYLQRDVKYLPGLQSPFDGIEQLTPNCRLQLGSLNPERYWPRHELVETDEEYAVATLAEHLKGLHTYFSVNRLKPVIGLSAGRDSRGVMAALGTMRPRLFTFVRSPGGQSRASVDSQTAAQLADLHDLDVEIIRLKAPPPLDELLTPFAAAFRKNTGYVRGNNSAWVEHYAKQASDCIFVRGFGGEVMRGFYPDIQSIDPTSLSKLYDVNSGSRATREAFVHFIEKSGFQKARLLNRPAAGQFYWEHRMGVWGASAMLESDMAFRSIPGYSSRQLFEAFVGLPPSVNRRAVFEHAVRILDAPLSEVPYSS